MSKSGKRNKPQSKLVCEDQVTEQSIGKINVFKLGQQKNPQQKYSKNIFIWANVTQLSDVAHGPRVEKFYNVLYLVNSI
jgi:hypothetical protein